MNDYFNIAVRNDCFCAHLYVRELVSHDLAENLQIENISNAELVRLADMHRGMVRASFGLYNTQADVDTLIHAVRKIVDNSNYYMNNYSADTAGNYHHNAFKLDYGSCYSTRDVVGRWLA